MTRAVAADRLAHAGLLLALYGVVLVLLMIGGLKFTSIEAQALQPYISSSPLLAWMYEVWSVQGASNALGIAELVIAALLAAAPFSPRAAVIGGAAGVVTFVVTCSLLLTLPSWEQQSGGFPALNADGTFLIKDVALAGVALWTLGWGWVRLQPSSRTMGTAAPARN